MKLQLDTTNKTVKVEENVKVIDLINLLKKMLPNDWEHFTLETHTEIIGWREPIYIKTTPYIEPYTYPWYCNTADMSEKVSMGSDGTDKQLMLKGGTFNVEA